jgi:hypothetical protein
VKILKALSSHADTVEEAYKQAAWDDPYGEEHLERKAYINGYRNLIDNMRDMAWADVEVLV